MVLWAWKDRTAIVLVSVGRWKETDIVATLTVQMQRGRPLILYEAGICLRDGSRHQLPRYSVAGLDRLPRDLSPRGKVTIAVSAAHVWQRLVQLRRGAEDVAVCLYVEDGAGHYYDSSEWVVFNATTPSMILPSSAL